MKEVLITISNRKIVNANELKEVFKGLKDGKHLVSVKDCRKRSLNQNAFYWSVVVPMVQKGLYDAGFDIVTDRETAHEVMKSLFIKHQVVSKTTGEVLDISGSSAALSVSEFNDYLDKVIRWASEYLGVVIPDPNAELVALAEYTAHQESIHF